MNSDNSKSNHFSNPDFIQILFSPESAAVKPAISKNDRERIIKIMKEKYPRATDEELLILRYRYNSIEKLKKLAEERGGKCLSDQYLGVSQKLRWTCGKIHDGKNVYVWEQFSDPIIKGAWCQKCRHANRKLNTKDSKHY